jgi:hypothetical protein
MCLPFRLRHTDCAGFLWLLGNGELRISQPLTIVQEQHHWTSCWENESLHYSRRNIQAILSIVHIVVLLILSVVCCEPCRLSMDTVLHDRERDVNGNRILYFSLVLLIYMGFSW